MKALVKAKSQEGIWLQDMPKPKIGHNDLRIKVKKTAICGTDIHIYNWDEWAQKTIPVPMSVGHEFVGVVAEIGSELQGFKVGDWGSGLDDIACDQCRNYRAAKRQLSDNAASKSVNRPDCNTEYITIPAVNAYPLPDDPSDDVAPLLDTHGNATHTALSFDLAGEAVLI